MPVASADSIDHFPAFLARLPSNLDLEALAREHKAFQRPRGVRSGTDLLRLALAWGPGGYSLQQVAAWAKLVKVPSAVPMEYQMREASRVSPISPAKP